MIWGFYLCLAAAALIGMLVLLLIVRARGLAIPLAKHLRALALWPWRARGALSALVRRLRRAATATKETALALLAHGNERYAVPWILVAGSPASGKSTLLKALDALQISAETVRNAVRGNSPREWCYLDHGVAIELSLGATTSGAFRNTLLQLDSLRPERPVDAVVLTVSAEILACGDARTIEEEAQTLSRQLWALQTHCSLVLPVYLVVTKSDTLPGFWPFWSAVAAPSAQIFGWSNPTQLGKRHGEGDLIGAFRSLLDRMHYLQLAALKHGVAQDKIEGFLHFPDSLMRLQEPLSLLARRVFATTVHHFAPFLRGVYFSGKSEDGEQLCFLRDLFEHKVFAERNLATAQSAPVWSRSAVLRRAQLATVFAFVALTLALVASASHLFWRVSHQIASIQTVHAVPVRSSRACPTLDRARALLSDSSLFELPRSYVAFPFSWFESLSIERRGHFVATEVLDAAVFPALQCRLASEAARLQTVNRPKPSSTASVTKEQSTLLARVAETVAWEDSLSAYGQIIKPTAARAQGGAVDVLARLVQAQLGTVAPELWYSEPALVRLGLQTAVFAVPAVADPQAQRGRTAAAILELSQIEQTQLRSDALRGFSACQRLGKDSGTPGDLDAVVDFGKTNGVEWFAATPTHNPCQELQDALRLALAALRESAPEYPVSSFEQSIDLFSQERCYDPLVTVRDAASGNWCHDFLKPSPRGVVAAALGDLPVAGLLKSLSGAGEPSYERDAQLLERSSFMQDTIWPQFRCQSSLIWKPAAIAAAKDMLAEYLQLTTTPGSKRLVSLPGIRAQLLGAVAGEIHRAQVPTGAQDGTPTPGNTVTFAVALGDFLQIAGLLAQLGFTSAEVQWASCVRDSALAELSRIEQGSPAFQLEASSLVEPSSPTPSTAAFFSATADATSAGAYFDTELEKLTIRVQQSAPYLQWLAATSWLAPVPYASASIVTRASETTKAIEAGTAATGSPVTNLRSFFQTVLAGISAVNCVARLQSEPRLPGAGEFSLALQRLYAESSSLCRERIQAQGRTQYLHVVAAFQQRLQGHFPFDSVTSRDASPEDVGDMARLLNSPDYASLGAEGASDPVNTFVRQLRSAVNFLQRWLDGSEPIQVSVTFRTRPGPNRASQDILSWTLYSGNATATYPNGATSVPWRPQTPMSLTLQWADRSPYRPAIDVTQADLFVDGTQATFREDGTWSLLRLIETHRDAPTSPKNASTLLRFSVPTSDSLSGASTEAAVVSLSVVLRASDGSNLPLQVFPRISPPLSFPTTQGSP